MRLQPRALPGLMSRRFLFEAETTPMQEDQLIKSGAEGNTHPEDNRNAPMNSAFVLRLGAVCTGLGSAVGQSPRPPVGDRHLLSRTEHLQRVALLARTCRPETSAYDTL